MGFHIMLELDTIEYSQISALHPEYIRADGLLLEHQKALQWSILGYNEKM
jgi:hypothetical protein